jgi:DNA-binding winged helix-turn-helix (wHTH) protein
MKDGAATGQAPALIVELRNGCAVVFGERVELPNKELKLLAELAARPGEVLSPEELIAAVWPEAPGMIPQDLYWHISQLRRYLGGGEKARELVRNKKGTGYVIGLDPSEIRVLERSAPKAPVQQTIVLDPPAYAIEEPEPPPAATVATLPAPSPGVPPRRLGWAVWAIGIAVLLAVFWTAGYLLAKGTTTPAAPPQRAASEQPPDADEVDTPSRSNQKRLIDAPRRKLPTRRGKERTRAVAPVAAPAPVPASDAVASNSSQAESTPKGKDAPAPAPALPPAPTAFLYHLVNEQTGQHFVTTDPGAVREYQARGFVGGAIGRVYATSEKNTKAIPTNNGTAYIFLTSAPKTEPASSTIPLWYATNNSGDFFYSTNRSEASAKGWSSTVIGYVRALS